MHLGDIFCSTAPCALQATYGLSAERLSGFSLGGEKRKHEERANLTANAKRAAAGRAALAAVDAGAPASGDVPRQARLAALLSELLEQGDLEALLHPLPGALTAALPGPWVAGRLQRGRAA